MTRNASAAVRARAAQIVSQINTQGKSLDSLLAQDASATREAPQERGLLRSLVYGTLRWQLRLEAALERLSTRPQGDLDPNVRALILVGLYQLLHTDIATHAAVAETVEGARLLKQPRAAGFINALLRRCQRERPQLCAELDQHIEVRTAHPAWLVDRLKADWPEQYVAILDANNSHPPMWLRVNARRTEVDRYLQSLQALNRDAGTSQYAREAVLLEKPADVSALPGFAQGDVSVQDAAAQLAARLLAPQPHDRVLDACAAPGGKTCHLLEIQPAIAELVAVDIAPDRLRKVRDNLDRLGLAATLRAGDAADPAEWWDGQPFQRILLDVPCSATGVIRRHPDIKLLRRPSDIAELAQRQAHMLRRVWPLLAPGGLLLYASCSALRAETGDIVANFITERADARDVTPERCRQANAPLPKSYPMPTPGLTIHAGEAQMDGFYYACLAKPN